MFRLVDLAALHQGRLADDGAHGIPQAECVFLTVGGDPERHDPAVLDNGHAVDKQPD